MSIKNDLRELQNIRMILTQWTPNMGASWQSAQGQLKPLNVGHAFTLNVDFRLLFFEGKRTPGLNFIN